MLTKQKEAYEGIRVIFGHPPNEESVERFNSVVAVGKDQEGRIASLEITFVDRWDESSPFPLSEFDDGKTMELPR